jgi:predicted Zn-dependent peptidase
MRNLILNDRVLKNEMQVVRAERRFRIEDPPEGTIEEVLMAQLFMAHPYRWPVIGWMSDLLAIDADDCRAFYAKFYHPGNATLVIVGDFEVATTKELVTKHFQKLQAGPTPPKVRTYDAPHRHSTRSIIRREAETGLLRVGFHGPRADSEDAPALDLLEQILTGDRKSRLHAQLVRDAGLAIDVGMTHWFRIDPEPLVLRVTLRPQASAVEAEKLLWQELDRIAATAPTEDEVEGARVARTSSHIRSFVSYHGRGNLLGTFQTVLGDWQHAFKLPELYSAVTPEQVRAAAAKYFDRQRSTTVILEPLEAKPTGNANDRKEDR